MRLPKTAGLALPESELKSRLQWLINLRWTACILIFAIEKLMRCVYCDMFVPVGVFVVDSTRWRYFGAGIDINAYNYILESVSYVISNAKLYAKINEIPDADSLTGLVSKKTFYRLLAAGMKRAQRHSKDFGLFIIDIDHK